MRSRKPARRRPHSHITGYNDQADSLQNYGCEVNDGEINHDAQNA